MEIYKNPRFQLFLFLLYSFFLIFRPFEGFFVQYCVSVRQYPSKNIVEDVYPFWTYSYPVSLLVLGILSEWEYFGHKWILLIGNIASQFSTIAVLAPPNKLPYTVVYLVASQVFFSLFFASHTSFFGIRYHIFTKGHIHFITSLIRSTMLMGRVVSSLIGQVIYSVSLAVAGDPNNMGLRLLPYLDLFSTLPCVAASFFFPSPTHYERPAENPMEKKGKEKKCFFYCYYFLKEVSTSVLRDYFFHFKVFFWSFFVIGSSSIHSLMLTYYQPLFQEVDSHVNYNGLAIACMHIMASIASFFPWIMKEQLRKYDEFIVILLLPIMSLLLVSLGLLTSIESDEEHRWLRVLFGYGMLCFYHAIYEFLNTSSYAQIATHMQNLRFTSIFALNSVLQVPIQIVLNFLVADSSQIFLMLGTILMCVNAFLLMMSAANQLYYYYGEARVITEDLNLVKKVMKPGIFLGKGGKKMVVLTNQKKIVIGKDKKGYEIL